MSQVSVLILRAPGANCDQEAQYAWELAGARVEKVHIQALCEQPRKLLDFQVLTLPGGFSYGDDISAGRILAARLERHLSDLLHEYVAAGNLVLGICNGFQTLVKLGLLPFRNFPNAAAQCTVTHNNPAGFQDRWVAIHAVRDGCAFLEKGRTYEVPIAHGEGRVVFVSQSARECAVRNGCVALQYVESEHGSTEGPANPNGSVLDLAGLCDESGRILGLMPHPERHVRPQQHPCWTSRERAADAPGDGLHLFEQAVRTLR